jgi:endonuclease/exonuclease/phosphatase (EEP) superfamily protein YafD
VAVTFIPGLVLAFPNRWFVLDLAGQMSNLFIWFGILLTLILVISRNWRRVIVAGIGTIFSLGVYTTVVKPPRVAPTDPVPGSQRLKVVSFNAYVPFVTDHSAFLKWALDHDPDVIIIVEGPLAPESLNQHLRDRGYKSDVVTTRFYAPLWSKHPLRVFREYWDGASMTPGGVNPFLIQMPDGQAVAICSVHLSSPRRPSSWQWDLDMSGFQWPLIRRLHGSWGMPLVLMGDFNTTRAGRLYRELYSKCGLTDAESSMYPQSTWPSNLPGFLGAGIDHCWVSPGVAVTKYEVGPAVLSDHHPLFVELHIPPALNPAAQRISWSPPATSPARP